MQSQEIGLLSNQELDAVMGGMMNDGRGQLDPKAPGAYVPNGGSGGDFWSSAAALGKAVLAVALAAGVIQGATSSDH